LRGENKKSTDKKREGEREKVKLKAEVFKKSKLLEKYIAKILLYILLETHSS